MRIDTINIQQYSEYLDTVDTAVFQQSPFHAKKFEHDGWTVEFIQASQEKEVYATCMLAYLPLMKVFKYCYVARGFLADYKDKAKLVKFTSSLRQYLKKKNVVYLETDPEIDLVQRDKDGNVVENGFHNYDVVDNLKLAGFLQLPLKQGYDLSKEFPALTLRRTAIKSCVDELLWIWQKKSNNIKDLHSHIWDSWADENGSIGKAYGYQLGVKHQYKEGMMDQVDRVLYDLKNNPYSRRIMTNIYVHQDLHEMNLYPCAYSMTFNVTKEPGKDKLTLNAILNQRSQDILAANNWNVCQYSILLMMIAQVCDMEAGELVHVIADCHIYDRHVPVIKELISRTPYPAPTVKLNPEIRDFYEFTTDDLIVENYQTWPQIKNIPIAI